MKCGTMDLLRCDAYRIDKIFRPPKRPTLEEIYDACNCLDWYIDETTHEPNETISKNYSSGHNLSNFEDNSVNESNRL